MREVARARELRRRAIELVAALRNVQTVALDGVARSIARRTGEKRLVVYDRLIEKSRRS